MRILSQLFIKKNSNSQQEKAVTIRAKQSKKSHCSDSPQDIDLRSADYIPLPPSPKTWEVDGRDEFHKEYKNQKLKAVFNAGWQQKHTKVIKLSSNLTPDQLKGQVGEIVAKAYRNTILKRKNANQIKPAARWAFEMLNTVPFHCTDTDKRRYNKIVKALNKANNKHKFKLIDPPTEIKQAPFKLSGGSNWVLSEIKRIPNTEKPDTAFIPKAYTADGILFIDHSGKSELASNGSQAALRKIDRSGCVISEIAINHSIYRIGYSPTGSFLSIMDDEGMLYIYDAFLNIKTKIDLQNDKRIKRHFKTTQTNYWGEFKSQVRAVDVCNEGDFVLFTLADEAWCCSITGDSQWGIRMPLNEGWERIVGRSTRPVISGDVERALDVFKLALPLAPKDIHEQYKVLAKQYHPDLNPNSKSAHTQMQEVNEAFQILTGVDPKQINFQNDESEITFFRRTSPDHIIDMGKYQLEFTIQSGSPQDWIYEASFLSQGKGAFLATYSGKIIKVDATGKPVLVYDVGSIPNEIVDAGKYLYILTSTRLYIIEERDNLVAFIDVFKQGRLLVTTTGFGLLDDKLFQWFSPSGTKIGEVSSQHPIRAVYDSKFGTVVETRQHRTVVKGLILT